jgi:hypothetical protein
VVGSHWGGVQDDCCVLAVLVNSLGELRKQRSSAAMVVAWFSMAIGKTSEGGGVGVVLYKGKGSCGYGILSLTTSSTKSNINSKFVKDLHSI